MSIPRVSVIMNVRNGAPWLKEAIESVLAQTYRDWELIAWDDRSTDESASIIQGYGDPRLRYVLAERETPLGPARDAAIRAARGEWIAFIDQDDVWLPRKLELQMALADDPATALIYGRTLRFGKGGMRDYDHRHEYQPLPEGDIFLRLFTHSCFIAMSSAVMRREAVVELGGIPEDIHVIPDYYLFAGLARKYRARAVQEVVSRYRVHGGSMSRHSGIRMHAEAMGLVDRYAPFLPARLAEYRRAVHATVMGVQEMFSLRTAARGVYRVIREGSLPFLISRPFAIAFRNVRRHVREPYWRQVKAPPRARAHAAAADGGGFGARAAKSVTVREQAALTLSVIVVNWKVRDLLRDCLLSLKEQTRMAAHTWEIIVVDNDSGDGTPEMMATEFPHVSFILNDENVGFGKANNQAFPMCRGKYVLLLNPDTVVLDHAVDRMVAIMEERKEIGALGCRLVSGDRRFLRWTGGSPPNLRNVACHFLLFYKVLPDWMLPSPIYLEHEPEEDADVGWVSGACLLLRREALTDWIFDDRFFLYCEDLELCDRLARRGWKITYTPRATIVHYDGRSLGWQSAEIQLAKLRSLRQMFLLHHGRGELLAYDFLVAVGFTLRYLLNSIGAIFAGSGSEFPARAGRSRHYLGEAWRVLWKRP